MLGRARLRRCTMNLIVDTLIVFSSFANVTSEVSVSSEAQKEIK